MSVCKECGMQFVFARNIKTGKHIPLDFISVPTEKMTLYKAWQLEDGRYECAVRVPGVPLEANERQAVSHFQTCTKPERFSKKAGEAEWQFFVVLGALLLVVWLVITLDHRAARAEVVSIRPNASQPILASSTNTDKSIKQIEAIFNGLLNQLADDKRVMDAIPVQLATKQGKVVLHHSEIMTLTQALAKGKKGDAILFGKGVYFIGGPLPAPK